MGCVSRGGPTGLYVMPAEPALAIHPADADPDSAAELAEGALHLLDPARPGGPDYMAAARMCLLAIEVADPDGTHRLVTVSLGLIDSSSGLVQVEGPDVRSGQQVVVPGL